MNCGQQLKKIRLLLGYSQNEFSKMLGIDSPSWCMYESGKKTPNFKTVRKIVDGLKQKGINLNYTDLRSE